MTEDFTFKKSLSSYKCAYYHFLDNFINSKNGEDFPHIIKFIKQHKLNTNDIYILNDDNENFYNASRYENAINYDTFIQINKRNIIVN